MGVCNNFSLVGDVRTGCMALQYVRVFTVVSAALALLSGAASVYKQHSGASCLRKLGIRALMDVVCFVSSFAAFGIGLKILCNIPLDHPAVGLICIGLAQLCSGTVMVMTLTEYRAEVKQGGYKQIWLAA